MLYFDFTFKSACCSMFHLSAYNIQTSKPHPYTKMAYRLLFSLVRLLHFHRVLLVMVLITLADSTRSSSSSVISSKGIFTTIAKVTSDDPELGERLRWKCHIAQGFALLRELASDSVSHGIHRWGSSHGTHR